ncbi:MAG: FtsB family cell division protein [Actinomycetota bacterium]
MNAEAGAERGRLRITGRAVVLAGVVVLLGIASVGVLRQFFDQRAEIDRLERQVEALVEERGDLTRQIERLHDPEYLERLARECLGMVRPGEIAFVVPSEEGESAEPSRC